MLDKNLEVTLNNVFNEARDQHHEYVTVEHLLLALLDNSSAAQVLRACGANLNELHSELSKFIQDNSPLLTDSDEHFSTVRAPPRHALVAKQPVGVLDSGEVLIKGLVLRRGPVGIGGDPEFSPCGGPLGFWCPP